MGQTHRYEHVRVWYRLKPPPPTRLYYCTVALYLCCTCKRYEYKVRHSSHIELYEQTQEDGGRGYHEIRESYTEGIRVHAVDGRGRRRGRRHGRPQSGQQNIFSNWPLPAPPCPSLPLAKPPLEADFDWSALLLYPISNIVGVSHRDEL